MNDLTLGERGDPGRRPAREGTEFSATKCGTLISRRGRPKNPLVARLMAEGVSRRTAFRRVKAKHKAWLAKLARAGNGRDHLNQHPDGYHPTPPRGSRALLARESFEGVVWECACGDGAISRILEAAGFDVFSTYLVDRGYGRGGHDFLADNTTLADHIVTNPPYGRRAGWPRSLSRTRSLVSGLAARCACCCGRTGRPRRRTNI